MKIVRLHPTQIIAAGFLLVILIGTIILSLPISINPEFQTNNFGNTFTTALFTSTSAVCVTGLIIVDTGTHWTGFGQAVILLLIQIGGLGFMTIGTLFAFVIRRKISFRERIVMQEALNQFKLSGIVRIARNILIMTAVIEGLGMLFLSFRFVPEYGLAKGLWFSAFHAISAFCNAGFDLFGQFGAFQSLTRYVSDPLINIVMMSLIIIGGLGFTVVMEVIQKRRIKKLSLHSKLVIRITIVLIIIGTLGIFFLEMFNRNTLGDLPLQGKILSSFFHSITPRTAGFNTLPTDQLTTAAIFLTIILMFIGGSSGSTAGGVKTTTIGVIFAMIISVLKGREDTEAFGRRIPMGIIKKAIAIIGLATGLIVLATLILSVTEAQHSFKIIFFEVVSAFGTVGLSLGLTPHLSTIGRIVIVFTMFFGRVGPLTIFLAFIYRKKHKKRSYKYPEEKVIVG